MESPNRKRAIIGILLITIGVVFLLDNLGYNLDLPYYLFSWPAIFIVLGIINLASGGKTKSAVIFFSLATIFYLDHFGILDISDLWPVFLILAGIIFIFRRKGTPVSDEHSFDEMAIFGGIEKQFVSSRLEGGKITSIFGGAEIDLRDSQAADGAVIDVFCMFGGVELTVPNHWKVHVNATAIFGGFSDNRKNVDPEPTATVYIKGFTLFGGGEIRS